MRRRKGFTLIELLVVIAIIALLVSILMPSLSRVKDLARRASCASNLHHLYLSYAMYMSDHGVFPPSSYVDPDRPEYYSMYLRYWSEDIADIMLKDYAGGEIELFWCPGSTIWLADNYGRTPEEDWFWCENTGDYYRLRATSYLTSTGVNFDIWSFRDGIDFYVKDDNDDPDKMLICDFLQYFTMSTNWWADFWELLGHDDGEGEPAGGNEGVVAGAVTWKAFADIEHNYQPVAGDEAGVYW